MANSTLPGLSAVLELREEDVNLLLFQRILLFVSRVAIDLFITQMSFSHVYAEIAVVVFGIITLVCAVAWDFGTEMTGFMMIKMVTVFFGRIVFCSIRTFNHFRPISRWYLDIIGGIVGFLFAVNILEAGVSNYKLGYPGSLVASFALIIPGITLLRPRSFVLYEYNYYTGTSWPHIIAYIIWNITFTIVQEPGELNMTCDTVFANTAGLVADLINCVRIHPGVFIHSRAQTLMWTLIFGVAMKNRPMGTEPVIDIRLEELSAGAKGLDAMSGLIVVVLMGVHCYVLFGPRRGVMRGEGKQWVFKKIQGTVFQGFMPVDPGITEHMVQSALQPLFGNVLDAGNLPDAYKPKLRVVEPEYDAEGNVIVAAYTSEEPQSFMTRWSPLTPLKKAILLGDAATPEEQDFGNTIPRVSYGSTVMRKMAIWPQMIVRTLLLSSAPVIQIAIFASLPCYGDEKQTGLSAAIFGFMTMAAAITTTATLLVASCPNNKLDMIKWTLFTFWVFAAISGLAQWRLSIMEKSGKGIVSQALMMPGAVVIVTSLAKVHTVPGWRPKWNNCCCVFGGIDKVTGSATFAGIVAFLSGIMLIRFLRMDTLTFAMSKSASMIIVRPTMFFVVKKLVYHAFAGFARFRHPQLTVTSNVGVSVMLGIATAILFTNTRTWGDMIIIVVGNWFTFLSKLWTLFGSIGSTKCKILEWYSWFMSTGKPSVAPGMAKQRLRGFEIQSQNFGTTLGLMVILLFYPIAKFVYGTDSMIYMLLFQTDLSLTFLVVALINEVIEDNFGQVVIGRLSNNDYDKLYSFKPSPEVMFGLSMNCVFGSFICSSGFLYRATKVGPWAPAPV